MNPLVVRILNALEESDEFDSVEVVSEYTGKATVEVTVEVERDDAVAELSIVVNR